MPFTSTTAAFASPHGAATILATLALATLMGGLLALVYRRTAGDRYNPDIAQSQIVLAALMALVMVIVADQISRAFGSVGVLSIMRFRVKMKGAGEALSLLGAVVVGMAAGVGLFREAIIGGCFLGLLTIVLARVFTISDKTPSILEEEA